MSTFWPQCPAVNEEEYMANLSLSLTSPTRISQIVAMDDFAAAAAAEEDEMLNSTQEVLTDMIGENTMILN